MTNNIRSFRNTENRDAVPATYVVSRQRQGKEVDASKVSAFVVSGPRLRIIK